jgi:hypothetical protein
VGSICDGFEEGLGFVLGVELIPAHLGPGASNGPVGREVQVHQFPPLREPLASAMGMRSGPPVLTLDDKTNTIVA